MKYAVIAGAVAALCAATGTVLAASEHHPMHVPAYIRKAVDDTSRPESDRKRDADRKPTQVLAFAGIKPGMKVGELLPGQNYYTRLLCRIVGDQGHVYTYGIKMHMPPPQPGAPARPRMQMPPPGPIGCDNVTASTQEASALSLDPDLDVVWTTENYHDLHNPMMGSPDMKQLDMAVYNALKPGGVFIVEDHAAEAGSGARDTGTLHRIDPALVRQEVESVGFKFAGESHVVANPSDNHSAKVFTMEDKTDRFLFKFRKPAG